MEAEEKLGSRLMVWWDGQGAARVLAHDEDALLLERAQGPTPFPILRETDVTIKRRVYSAQQSPGFMP